MAPLALARLGLAVVVCLYTAVVGASVEEDGDAVGLLQLRVDSSSSGVSGGRTVAAPYRQRLANHGDLQYTGAIAVGGQRLQAILDTGSAELLLFAADCGSCGLAGGARGFNHTVSTSFIPGKQVKTHVYGSGAAQSHDGSDLVQVGILEPQRVNFWEAIEASMPVLETASFQAVAGLGPAAVSSAAALSAPPSGTEDPAEVPHRSGGISLLGSLGFRYFSACLSWETQSPGYLIWNDRAPQAQPVAFAELPVASASRWSVAMTRARLEGKDGVVELGCSGGCDAVLDTGTSLMSVPSSVYDVASQAISKLDSRCSNLQDMPNLVITLNGHDYALPPQSYIGVIEGPREQGGEPWLRNGTKENACELLLMDAGTAGSELGPLWVVGLPFFRYYYTTFDLGEEPADPSSRRIWTAPASSVCEPADSLAHSLKLSLARTLPPWKITGADIRVPGWSRKVGVAGHTTVP